MTRVPACAADVSAAPCLYTDEMLEAASEAVDALSEELEAALALVIKSLETRSRDPAGRPRHHHHRPVPVLGAPTKMPITHQEQLLQLRLQAVTDTAVAAAICAPPTADLLN